MHALELRPEVVAVRGAETLRPLMSTDKRTLSYQSPFFVHTVPVATGQSWGGLDSPGCIFSDLICYSFDNGSLLACSSSATTQVRRRKT